MPNTTNFNWTTPADTDLVKDGALAIRTLANGIDTSFLDLKGGTTGQVLAKATNTDLDFQWVAQDDSNAIQNAIIDAKGDLIVGTAADTPARLAVGGTNGHVLTVDSAEASGMKWAAVPSGSTFVGVSVTRTSDYTTTNDVEETIAFNSEFYDTDGFHDNSTNNSRLTVPSGKAGKYLVNFNTQWQANSNTGIKHVAIKKNGNQIIRSAVKGTDATQQTFQTIAIADLAVGDYITVTTYQNSGVNQDLYFSTATPYYSYLSMAYLGA